MEIVDYISDASSIDDDEPLSIEFGTKNNNIEPVYTTCTEQRQPTSRDPRDENLWPYYFAASKAQAQSEYAQRQAKRRQRAVRGQRAVKHVLVFHEPDELHRRLLSDSLEPFVITPEQLHGPTFRVYEEDDNLAGEITSSDNDIIGVVCDDDTLPSIETDDNETSGCEEEEDSHTNNDFHPIDPAVARSPQHIISHQALHKAGSAPIANCHVLQAQEVVLKAIPISLHPKVNQEGSEQSFVDRSSAATSSDGAVDNPSENPRVVQDIDQRRRAPFQQQAFGNSQPNVHQFEQQSISGFIGPLKQPLSKPIKSEFPPEPQNLSGYHLPRQQADTGFAPLREQAPSISYQPITLSNTLLIPPLVPHPATTHIVQTTDLSNTYHAQPLASRPVNTHLVSNLIDRPSAAALAKMEHTAPTSKGDGTTRGDQEIWTQSERQLLHRAAAQWWHWKDNKTLSRGASSGAALYRYFEFVFAQAGLSRSYYQLKNQWSRNERAKFGRSEQRDKKDGTARDLVTSARPSAKAKVEAELARELSNKRKRMPTVVVHDEDDADDSQDNHDSQSKSVRYF